MRVTPPSIISVIDRIRAPIRMPTNACANSWSTIETSSPRASTSPQAIGGMPISSRPDAEPEGDALELIDTDEHEEWEENQEAPMKPDWNPPDPQDGQ